MITSSQMYWITRCDAIGAIATIVLVLSFFVMLILLGVAYMSGLDEASEEEPHESRDNEHRRAVHYARIAVAVCSVSGLITMLLPTTKEMAAIMVVPRIAASETLAELGEEAKTLVVEWLDELHPAGKKEEPSK